MAYRNHFRKLVSLECQGLEEINKKKKSEGGGEHNDK